MFKVIIHFSHRTASWKVVIDNFTDMVNVSIEAVDSSVLENDFSG